MKLTQIDLAEGRGGSQREVSASEAVARAEEACGGTLLLFEPDGVPRAAVAITRGLPSPNGSLHTASPPVW